MRLDLRLMRYVIAVADEGGFQAAADALHMAQPPLSRQVAGLEQMLGIRLFDRRPTRLTEAGQVFVESARQILADVDRAVERTRMADRGELGTINVGFTVSAAYDEMPRLLEAMRANYPHVTLDHQELWDVDLEAGLLDGRLHVGLGRALPHHPGFAVEMLRRERYALVVGTTHPLAGRDQAALGELRGEPFRYFPRRLAPTYYDLVLAAVHSTGESFEVIENPVPGLRNLGVRDGTGFTILPESVAGRLGNGVVSIPLTDELPRLDLELLWQPETAPPTVALLVEVARKLANDEGW